MNEIEYKLPDAFRQTKSDVFVHYYSASKSSIRNKVVLSEHLICILINGRKEIFCKDVKQESRSGDFLFLSKGSVLMSELVPESNIFESILIFFSDRFLSDVFLRLGGIPRKGIDHTQGLVLPSDEFLRSYSL